MVDFILIFYAYRLFETKAVCNIKMLAHKKAYMALAHIIINNSLFIWNYCFPKYLWTYRWNILKIKCKYRFYTCITIYRILNYTCTCFFFLRNDDFNNQEWYKCSEKL